MDDHTIRCRECGGIGTVYNSIYKEFLTFRNEWVKDNPAPHKKERNRKDYKSWLDQFDTAEWNWWATQGYPDGPRMKVDCSRCGGK